MRVLFVTHNVPRWPGDAAGSFVLRLATALQAAGHVVEILAPGTAEQCGSAPLEGVMIHRVRYAADADMTLAYTGTMVEQVRQSWRARRALVGLLRAFRRETTRHITMAEQAGMPFDVVHVHWWFPAGLALWKLPALRGHARIITMHGSDVRLGQRSAVTRSLMQRVLAWAQVRTTVSSWLQHRVTTACPGMNVEVAPMPVDLRHFMLPESGGTRYGVLFVGRLNAQKGLTDLLHAMAHRSLEGVPLDVVGDGPEQAALHALADRLGLGARVRWHGALPQPALVPMYQQAAAVVIPSREEGLGLVAVEAQLCGAPVVAYASGGLVDVVQPEHGGALVEAGDIPALAAAIANTMNDGEHHASHGASHDASHGASHGESGRALMLARFSPDAVARGYIDRYTTASERASQRAAVPAGKRAPWWTLIQLSLLVATLIWAGRALVQQWSALTVAAATMQVAWSWVALASLIVLGTYAMLIGAWRLLLAGWGSDLRFPAAVRIWTIANLGRYLPGKVWSVGALGLLARREGVSGSAAAGAAILGTMLNIGAGFGVLALSGAQVLGVFRPWLQTAAITVSVAFLLGTALLPLLLPVVLRRVAAWRGTVPVSQQLRARTLWAATAINIASWCGYGLAFATMARGVTPQISAQADAHPALFIVIWTASYLSGYLVLLVPGGIGVREAVMSGGLVALGLAAPADATLLALASRVWLTVWELLPGLVALAATPGALRTDAAADHPR